MTGAQPLLRVTDLKTHFHTRDGIVRAVDGVSFDVRAGETLAIVGESGCGKSVTAMSILRLLPMPPARIAGGRIVFQGRNLLELPEEEMRAVRGNLISMIFQEPMTSLNPVLTIGQQVAALELDAAALDARRRHRQQAQDRHRGHALAAARLADDRQRLAGGDLEGHTVDRPHHAVARMKVRPQVVDSQQRWHA